MKNYKYIFGLLTCCFSIVSCGSNTTPLTDDTKNDITIGTGIVNSSFVGNGVQWGGYDIVESWTGNTTLSDSDWNKLFKRVRFMRPPLVRVMVAPGWNYIIDNQYDVRKSEPVLCKILEFCQHENIDVVFGEWGHQGDDTIDNEWLNKSVNFLDWLINTKGFSCIRYFNMVNEPNGDWSTIDGNYTLWETLINQFYAMLVEKELDTKITILGPDVAVWDASLTSWITNSVNKLNGKIGAYDIHSYPADDDVHDGSYLKMVEKYRNVTPVSKEILMSELGFKYDATSTYGKENASRIANDKYASDDSNMLTYDAFYAIDIADAMIQNMLAGYGGSVLWNLDDAMYNGDGTTTSTKLKRWGFWNILGGEKFENVDDENIRPWFYTASLLCRYFPQGTKIYSVNLPNKYGVRAVAGEYNGKYSIAIVNSHTVSYTINLKMQSGKTLGNLDIYQYISGKDAEFVGNIDEDGFAVPKSSGETYNFKNGASVSLSLPAQSFYLITNIE